MVLGRKGLGAALAVLAAVMLVVAGLFAAPARAQAPPTDVVVDLVVETEQGECGEDECADNERPVTFDVVAVVNANESIALSPQELAAINEVLDAAAFDITVEDPDGGTQEVEDGETICLEPGEYNALAEPADETALAEDIAAAVNTANPAREPDLTAAEVDIIEFDDTFTVEECPVDPDDNGGDVNIDDRDQENTCNQVVNIVNEDVQNNDVDNSQDDEAAIDDQQAGDPADATDELLVDEVTDEQIVEIAQELNVSPVIVQTCIQQNAGRDANINSNNAEENIEEEIIEEEAVVLDDRSGEVLAGSFPNKSLPNTGGISPFAVLVALGFTFLLAALSVGYAATRRGS